MTMKDLHQTPGWKGAAYALCEGSVPPSTRPERAKGAAVDDEVGFASGVSIVGVVVDVVDD
ncbi:hypothetical protein [Streptomyces spectabilis]|uniref:Uncharacterized protein n=1 Tax=Streptomyces spectabilis TaxID=68270 RepID=A0A5P2X4F8_STRST|nr:hypothetical protein [Streptomyces spectabilis]MBB5107887.1 hypothetical protein [Streptomyces spectabilis]MCI3899776.1 hypothetical protein [Streptomyces spectabilis]QEV57446.1 hypothetical protein CP982_00760 [Streptomyces spectabilis]